LGVKDSIEKLPNDYYAILSSRPVTDRKGKVAKGIHI
jgi:hypothetical protein